MFTLLSILFLGFFLGMRHATDPDHVVAVTTIVSRERSIRSAAFIGAVWGIGHTLTLLLAGGAIVLLGLVVPPRLGLSLEFSVALMLIFLGFWNVNSFLRWLKSNSPAGKSSPSDVARASSPASNGGVPSPVNDDHTHHHTRASSAWRPLVVGVVHGLAGSAAVALLVLPMIHNPVWAIGYLMIFGAGTIGGMMLITAAVALPFTYAATRSRSFHRHLGFAAGFLSVAFGLFLVYQIGFVQGLFTR
ncbi:MAG: hypothetical protein JWQ04_2514 [Pedosphaera sp.]|nr:hypothetical protein [Pedosphaera sp.]